MNDEIAAFLADGNYATIEEWMADSDYTQLTGDEWYDEERNPVNPEGAILGAMEACGWFDPKPVAAPSAPPHHPTDIFRVVMEALDTAAQTSPPPRHPDDIFHVIMDALGMAARMSGDDMARYNAGRPPWNWYDADLSNNDPKTTEDGWRDVVSLAEKFVTAVLDNGISENVLGEVDTREAMRRE